MVAILTPWILIDAGLAVNWALTTVASSIFNRAQVLLTSIALEPHSPVSSEPITPDPCSRSQQFTTTVALDKQKALNQIPGISIYLARLLMARSTQRLELAIPVYLLRVFINVHSRLMVTKCTNLLWAPSACVSLFTTSKPITLITFAFYVIPNRGLSSSDLWAKEI